MKTNLLKCSLNEISDFLYQRLRERIKNGDVPVTGMTVDGVSDDGTPVTLQVILSERCKTE